MEYYTNHENLHSLIYLLSDIDDCQPNPCLHGGVCKDGINSFVCGCAHGFKGDTCSISMFHHLITL